MEAAGAAAVGVLVNTTASSLVIPYFSASVGEELIGRGVPGSSSVRSVGSNCSLCWTPVSARCFCFVTSCCCCAVSLFFCGGSPLPPAEAGLPEDLAADFLYMDVGFFPVLKKAAPTKILGLGFRLLKETLIAFLDSAGFTPPPAAALVVDAGLAATALLLALGSLIVLEDVENVWTLIFPELFDPAAFLCLACLPPLGFFFFFFFSCEGGGGRVGGGRGGAGRLSLMAFLSSGVR